MSFFCVLRNDENERKENIYNYILLKVVIYIYTRIYIYI